MNHYSYTAIDEQGRQVAGQFEAVDWDAAVAQLTARGLKSCRQTLLESTASRLPELAHDDAVQLTAYLVELTRSGVPLGGALRALARDARRGPLAVALDAIAQRIEAGQDLAGAVDSLGPRFPAQLRESIRAAAASGRLADSLGELLAQQRRSDDLTRQFWQAISYPALLIGLLAIWLMFVSSWLIPGLNRDGEDGLVELLQSFGGAPSKAGWNPVTASMRLAEFSYLAPRLLVASAGALAVAAIGAALWGGRALVSRLAALAPLVGPAWRYRGLSDFAGLMALFLRQQLPLAQALRISSMAARDPAMRFAASRIEADSCAGRSLQSSMARQWVFPPTMLNVIGWGESNAALADSFETAQEMFAERFALQVQLIRLLLPPIVFVAVAGSALFVMFNTTEMSLSLIRDLI